MKHRGLIVMLVLVAIAAFTSVPARAQTSEQEQIEAARGVLQRLIPEHAGRFVLELLPRSDGKDVFEIASQDGKVVLRGSTGGTICTALNWYLKYYCNCHVSWCGDQLNVPDPLPTVPEMVRIVSPCKYRVYFNYCTLCYTGAWWDWERWQREIDWMALNGVNMPLAVTGLEGVWYHTLRRFEMSDEEVRSFLVGPSWFGWQWMTNIESYGGPLPKSWIDSHIELGRKILDRERALGMTPIQQGFTGYVPRALRERYPDAQIAQEQRWCGFTGTCQLDPLDPLFEKLGRTFYEEQIRLFGTSHHYGADPFHEGSPPKPGNEYLGKVGRKVFDVMKGVDPEAVWVMQSWSIRQPIATTAPKGRLLVVDLNGGKWGRTGGFWGYDFVTGLLNNFGGRTVMHGDLRRLAGNPFAPSLRKFPKNASGMGLFMEGIENNPVYFNLALEMAWRTGPVDARDWAHQYARRRYGEDSESARQAWDILLDTAYRSGTDGTEPSSILAARPALSVRKSGPNAGFRIPYPAVKLAEAWTLLLEDAPRLRQADPYGFDVVDVGRQVLSNLGQEFHAEMAHAFRQKDREGFQASSRRFLELVRDVDVLLGTREEFLFGRWLENARSWATTPEERDLYSWSASMLLTQWGCDGEPLIFDYAWREWSGLVGGYYHGRWQLFLNYLDECLKNGVVYDDAKVRMTHGRQALKANEIFRRMTDWETDWITKDKTYPPRPVGHAVDVAARLCEKYKPLIKEMYSGETGTAMGGQGRGGIKVVTEHISQADIDNGLRKPWVFESVPAPSNRDRIDWQTGSGVTFAAVPVQPGKRKAGVLRTGHVKILNDGHAQPKKDDIPTSASFWDGTTNGKFVLDLGEQTDVERVVTYSWHFGMLGPQKFGLYGAEGPDRPPYDLADDHDTLVAKGWNELADVNSARVNRRGRLLPIARQGGQHAVMIHRPGENGKVEPIGTYRYLLWNTSIWDEDPTHRTFYGEIDVY